MAKHNSRDQATGRFTKVNPEKDVVAPDAGIPTDHAYGEVRRYAPAADVLAQGGEQELRHRAPIEINGETGQRFGERVSDVPGLPGDVFGGAYQHDPARGMASRLNHRRSIVVNAETGQELDADIARVAVPDLRTNAMLAAVQDQGGAQAEFMAGLVTPMTGPGTEVRRRLPGSDGYRLPSMYGYPDVEE